MQGREKEEILSGRNGTKRDKERKGGMVFWEVRESEARVKGKVRWSK